MDGRSDFRVRRARVDRRLIGSPLFPSDLEGTAARRPRLRVAGRVIDQGAGWLRLADAFTMIAVEGTGLEGLAVGELALFEGRWNGTALTKTRIEWRKAADPPRGDGDIHRFVFEGNGPRLLARSRALAEIRRFFAQAGFIEVETPLRVPAPGVDAHIEAVRASSGWLITSPELEMKRLIVAGVPRQFQLARVSREEELGSLHEPEFTLLEWYRAFSGFEQVISDTEELVLAVTSTFHSRPELLLPDGRKLLLRRPFERLSMMDAFQQFAGIADAVDLSASEPDRFFQLLVDRVEPALARIDRPLFLVDYPISQAALARPNPANPRLAERFELYVAGIELSNGYGELTDPLVQRDRFRAERERREASGETVYPINECFLSALVEGLPPCAGNALGFDRLLMLVLGRACIQDVIAFPRERL